MPDITWTALAKGQNKTQLNTTTVSLYTGTGPYFQNLIKLL
jgi:hypothetical protein